MRGDRRTAGLRLRDRREPRAAAVAVVTVLAGTLAGACGGTARASLEPTSTPISAPNPAALPTRTSSAPAAQPNLRPPVVGKPGQGPAVTDGPAPAAATTTVPHANGSPGAATTTTTTTLASRPAAGPSCRAPDGQRSAAVIAYAKSLLPMTPVRTGPATNSSDRTWSVVAVIENDTGSTNMVALVHCVGMEWTVVGSGPDRARLAPCTEVIPAAVRRTLGVC